MVVAIFAVATIMMRSDAGVEARASPATLEKQKQGSPASIVESAPVPPFEQEAMVAVSSRSVLSDWYFSCSSGATGIAALELEHVDAALADPMTDEDMKSHFRRLRPELEREVTNPSIGDAVCGALVDAGILSTGHTIHCPNGDELPWMHPPTRLEAAQACGLGRVSLLSPEVGSGGALVWNVHE